jgi:hypothetical protein
VEVFKKQEVKVEKRKQEFDWSLSEMGP